MKRYYSLGNICNSKLWISLELRPHCGWMFSLGKTYNGTRAGIVASFGRGVLIAHIR